MNQHRKQGSHQAFVKILRQVSLSFGNIKEAKKQLNEEICENKIEIRVRKKIENKSNHKNKVLLETNPIEER